MSSTTDVHPEQVLQGLLARGHRAQVQRTLKAIHAICKTQFENGNKDFSVTIIGRIAEQQSVCNGRSLSNPTSAIYRELISAWASYAGPPAPPPPKELASMRWLLQIDNLAIRSLVQSVLSERNMLVAQLNSLKSKEHSIINRRPLGANVVVDSKGTTAVLEMSAQLTGSEREALEVAISPQFFVDQGWHEVERGEVRKDNGAPLYQPGYTDAIRRILGRPKNPNPKKVS